MKRIGIMGGTFNPLHKGHLALVKEATKQFILDEVIFVPAGNPPHKDPKDIIDKEHRFEMVKMAVKNKKPWHFSRIEIDRKGISYAVDTFKELNKKYHDKAKLFYIMGIDSINEILSWKKPLELFKMCEFIVGTRPGSKIRTLKRLLKFPPLQKEVDKIHLIELNENISSSKIREKVSQVKSIRKLVPSYIERYIKSQNLYQNSK